MFRFLQTLLEGDSGDLRGPIGAGERVQTPEGRGELVPTNEGAVFALPLGVTYYC